MNSESRSTSPEWQTTNVGYNVPLVDCPTQEGQQEMKEVVYPAQAESEATLQKAHDELERRVRERTAALEEVNAKLQAEVAERQRIEQALRESVAQQQQIEDGLRKSEARYRAIVEDQTELICRFLPDGTLTFVNEAYCRYFSKQRHELIGHRFTALIPEEDQEYVAQQFASLSLAQPTVTYEHRVKLPNNEIRWQQWTDRALFDDNGEFIEFQAVGRDITPLKQTEITLKQTNETLESRVQERTAELRQTIAELHSGENALRESEERFRQMAETIHEVFWVVDLVHSRTLYVSPSYETIWRRPLKSLYERPESFIEAIHPEDRDRAVSVFEQQQNVGFSQEYRIIQPDGSIRWIWDRAFPVEDQAGKPYRLIGVAQDITQRKQIELSLQQQVERERVIAAIAQRIRQSLNLDTILKTAVSEVRELLQADRVLIYRVWPNRTGSVVMESVLPDLPSVAGRTFPEEVFPYESQLLYEQGRVQAIADVENAIIAPCLIGFLQQFSVKAKLVVPILQETHLWGLLIMHQCRDTRQWQSHDIELLEQLATQLAIAIQQSELYEQVKQFNANLENQIQERTEELQQALIFEALLKRITDKVRDSLDEDQILQTALTELALGLKIDYCDNGIYNLAQRTSTIRHQYDASGISSQSQIISMADHPQIYQQLLEGQSFQFCKLHPTKNWMISLTCPILDDQGVIGDLWLFREPALEAVFTDAEIRLTQQVATQCAIAIRQARLYKAAQAQVEELEKLNRLKDDFLSTVSHELRSPVSNMKMAIQMLDLTLNKESPTTQSSEREAKSALATRRYLQILQNECQREIELINDLLDLQRLEAEEQALSLKKISLQPWLLQNLKPFQERAQQRQQILQVTIAPELPTIFSEEASLERILTELLTNACKYTPPGAVIAFTADIKANNVQISVCNWGIEIPHNEVDRIFDKFYRVPNADPWKQGGTGLGLALVRKLVQRLGYTIDVKSTNGQTCFTVTLTS